MYPGLPLPCILLDNMEDTNYAQFTITCLLLLISNCLHDRFKSIYCYKMLQLWNTKWRVRFELYRLRLFIIFDLYSVVLLCTHFIFRVYRHKTVYSLVKHVGLESNCYPTMVALSDGCSHSGTEVFIESLLLEDIVKVGIYEYNNYY